MSIPPDSRDIAANCVTKNSVTELSTWTLSSGAPTALTLVHLRATAAHGPAGKINGLGLGLLALVAGGPPARRAGGRQASVSSYP